MSIDDWMGRLKAIAENPHGKPPSTDPPQPDFSPRQADALLELVNCLIEGETHPMVISDRLMRPLNRNIGEVIARTHEGTIVRSGTLCALFDLDRHQDAHALARLLIAHGYLQNP